MKVSSFFFISTLVSGSLALSIPFGLSGSIQSREQVETRAVQDATSFQQRDVRPRECEEPAEPEEPSEEERKNGATRPPRPARPSNC